MDSEDIVRKFHQKRGRIRDPGSGKNPSRIRIPDPGGKKAPDPGSGSATLLWGMRGYRIPVPDNAYSRISDQIKEIAISIQT
jgi:hypothetical protein